MSDSGYKPPGMLSALLRAAADLAAPPLRRIVVASLVLATAILAALWLALAIVLDRYGGFGWRWLDRLIDLLGVLAAAALSWLLFPAVAT
ncbi:MAG: hypothetical protein ACREFH_15640, partial [Stellaceae bacterium]